MAIEIDDDCWRRWLDDARRDVVCAAERVVYARRYGWDSPEDYERLQDAVDTLGALSHQWLSGEVPYATVGNTTEQPNTADGRTGATPSTTPARPGPSPSPVRRPSEGHHLAMPT